MFHKYAFSESNTMVLLFFFFSNEARITKKNYNVHLKLHKLCDEKARGNLQEGVMHCTATNALSK